MDSKKPKLEDLLKQVDVVKEADKPRHKPKQRLRAHKDNQEDSLDVEIISLWVPHLVATDFDRVRSIQLAFPERKYTDDQARGIAQRLIVHPMFTDVIAAHIDSIEQRMVSSERYVLDRLYRQAEANIYDYFIEGEDGKIKPIPPSHLSKWQKQNVKKLRIQNRIVELRGDKRVIEQTIDLEIVDSFRAVALLGKNLGMFVERVELDFGKQTADRLEAALERVKQRKIASLGHQQSEDQSGASGPVH